MTNPVLQRFRERFDGRLYPYNIKWEIRDEMEKFILTELSARDARVVSIIEKMKVKPGTYSREGLTETQKLNLSDREFMYNQALDDLLAALKEQS